MTKFQETFSRHKTLLTDRLLTTSVCLVLTASLTISAVAQQPSPQAPSPQAGSPAPTSPPPDPFYAPVTHPNESKFLIHLAEDQKEIWTSPFHLKPGDAKWLVPMAGITTGLMVTDPQSSYAMRLGDLSAWKTASNAGLASAMGMTGAA